MKSACVGSQKVQKQDDTSGRLRQWGDEALYAGLSKSELLDFRKKFPVLDDGDDFEVRT